VPIAGIRLGSINSRILPQADARPDTGSRLSTDKIQLVYGSECVMACEIDRKWFGMLSDIDVQHAMKEKRGRDLVPHRIHQKRRQQWVHVNDILSRPLEECYQAQVITNFKWEDWIDASKAVAKPHVRSDTRLKNYPNRGRPIEGPK